MERRVMSLVWVMYFLFMPIRVCVCSELGVGVGLD